MDLWNKLTTLWVSYADTICTLWKRRFYVRAVLTFLSLPVGIIGAIVLFWTLFELAFGFLVLHWADIAIIVGVPVCLFSWLATRKKGTKDIPPPPPPVSIELVKARADNIYPLMAQSGFVLFTELCRYLPGLIRPFSLGAVEAPTHYSITASFVTVFHLIVSKGKDDTPASTVREILTSLIGQHLRAQDLPLTVPATYTNEAGETYPGLVCDGVYDCGQFLKIDLVITDEAETVRLKARDLSKLEGNDGTTRVPHDPDFD